MARSQTPFLFFLLLISLINNSVFVQCVHHHHHFINSSTLLSLPLYTYPSIVKQRPLNYTALMLSRLASDIVRFNFIHSKIQHTLHNDFSAHELLQPDSLGTAVFPGASIHFVRIGVGQPAKQVYLIADTGSGLTWLQCKPCTQCFKQSGPIFDPSKSSSFAPLACHSRQCASLPDYFRRCYSGRQCGFLLNYGDGSFSSGEVATETLAFNSVPVKGVAIGCGRNGGGRGNFADAAGILGLNDEPESFPNQIKASSFSYCLVDMDSKKKFSDLLFNYPAPRDSTFVPMLRNPRANTGFYYVGLTGIRLGRVLLPIPASVFGFNKDGNGGVVLDSGSTTSLVPPQVYDTLNTALLEQTRGIPRLPGESDFGTCYKITSPKVYAKFPKLAFVFSNGKTWWLEPWNYLRRMDSRGKFCLYILRSWLPVSIIGNIQQERTRITFDLANRRIGFSRNKC